MDEPVSDLKVLVPIAIRPTGRQYVIPGYYYLVDTSGYSGNVTFLLPPSASCTPGDRCTIKKVSSDANGIAVTPWNAENLNGANTPSNITTLNTSHTYIPGCPSSYGGQVGWVSW